MIQAIFFDFNGVIIDDERIHLKAYREVLLGENVPLTDEDYFASLGMDDAAFVRAAYARAGQTVTDEVTHALIKREHELHRQFVSMAERSEIEYVLGLAALNNRFSIVVSAGPGLPHKPAPDCYQRALELLNERRRAARELPLLASECLVIEDAPPGIAAARAAGMRTIGVTTTVTEADLRAAQADIVTPNLSDWTTGSVHHLFD